MPSDAEFQMPLPGAMKGFVSARGSLTSPSEVWPQSVSQVLAAHQAGQLNTSDFLLTFSIFLSAAVASSSGMVSIIADNLGYGEAFEYNQTYLSKIPYEQATALGWIAASQYVAQTSNGCSVLDMEATTTGTFHAAWLHFILSFGAVLGISIVLLRNRINFETQDIQKVAMRLYQALWHSPNLVWQYHQYIQEALHSI